MAGSTGESAGGCRSGATESRADHSLYGTQTVTGRVLESCLAEWQIRDCGYRSPVIHPESRIGNRFSLADGTSTRRLETVPLPEHEPAPPAFGRHLRQPAPLGMEAFPKVFQVIRDLFFRPSDGGGDFLCRKRTFLEKGAKLTPYGLRFLRNLMDRPCFFARGFVSHDVPILSKRNRPRGVFGVPGIACIPERDPLPDRLDRQGKHPAKPDDYRQQQ
jgi:hypothetical protein